MGIERGTRGWFRILVTSSTTLLGLSAIAVSLYLRNEIPTDYARTARLARAVIEQALDAGLRKGQVASVNIPPLLPDENPTGIDPGVLTSHQLRNALRKVGWTIRPTDTEVLLIKPSDTSS